MKKTKSANNSRIDKRKKKLKIVLVITFISLFSIIGVYMLRKSSAVVPTGTYTNWWWSPPSTGFTNVVHGLTIEKVTTDSSYFWAHQIKFIDGVGGYIGLQSNGLRVDGSRGKTVIFSIFGAGLDATAGSCHVQQAGFDGYDSSGSSCKIAYDWVIGRKYNMRLTLRETDSTGKWWHGFVKDTVTGTDTFIGKIKVPLTWKGLGGWSVMWTEYFGPQPATCKEIPYSQVIFHDPIADSGTIKPIDKSNKLSSNNDCLTSSVTDITGGTVHKVGNPLFQPPDTLSPIVTVNNPQDGATVSSPVDISAYSTDNVGTKTMEILVNNSLVKSVSGNSISMSWSPVTSKGKGKGQKQIQKFIITINARDSAGNVGTKNIAIYTNR